MVSSSWGTLKRTLAAHGTPNLKQVMPESSLTENLFPSSSDREQQVDISYDELLKAEGDQPGQSEAVALMILYKLQA
jgi:hypothetical protein